MIHNSSITLAVLLTLSAYSFGQASSKSSCTSNCTTSTQKVAPTVSTSTATNSNSNASSANDSAVSTQSGNNINPTISPTQQQSQGNQSASQNTTGTISGGNTSSQANGNNSAGGSASGTNTSSNQSSASGTNKSSNANSTGASTSNATTGNNTNSVTGGRTSSNSKAQGGSGGSATGGTSSSRSGGGSVGSVQSGASNGAQTTTIDTGDKGTYNTNVDATSKFIPSMQPQIPFTPIAGSNLVEIPMTCGPLQTIVHNEVTGVMAGIFRTKKFINGTTDDLAPYINTFGIKERFHREALDDGRKGYILYGHQPVMIAAVIGIAGGRSIGGGGTTANQASGQLGLGGTSSIQQIVMKIVLRDCEYGTVLIQEPPPPVAVVAPPVVEQPKNPYPVLEIPFSPRVNPSTPVVHHKKKHKPIPACVTGNSLTTGK